jgi:hypothetical protein
MIILTGAPETSRLEWSEKTLQSDLSGKQAAVSILSHTTSTSPPAFSAQWRQLSIEGLQMRPILPKLNIHARLKNDIDRSPAEFLSPTELFLGSPSSNRDSSNDSYISSTSTTSTDDLPDGLSEFYDHSFTIHDAIPSSELSTLSELTPGTPTYESSEEFSSPTPGSNPGIIRVPSQRRLSQVPRPKHLSDLEDIPNAEHLRSIEPQTMTVNLIVAILSISDPRTVRTGAKYGKPRDMELVEVMVGDETKSGFSITMWLPREMHVNWKDGVKATPEGSRSALRRDIKGLRARDVVILQNVALSSFRGKVHGQSLKKDVTKVDLLFRKKIDDEDIGGIYSVQSLRNATDNDPQLLKVKRVRDWMVEFVGERKGNSRRAGRRQLPPDTQ